MGTPTASTLQKALQNLKDSKKPKEEDIDTKFKDVTFAREGNKMIFPEGMSHEEAAVWIARQIEKEKTIVQVSHVIDCYPVEGAHALLSVLQNKYGFVDVKGDEHFFGETPPTLIGVEIEPGKTIQVPWGRFELPNVEGFLHADFRVMPDKTVKFKLSGEIRRKSEDQVNEIVMLLRNWIKEHSIFRGKAISVVFPDADSDGPFSIQPGYLPSFMDLTDVHPEELIFTDEVQDMIETALFAPIEHTDVCRFFKIPLKRGILLEGPYGVGKTLAAYVTAAKCVNSKARWTFIYVKAATDLGRAIAMARQYQPCVVFAEDINQIQVDEDGDEAPDARTAKVNEILNTLDGVDAKNTEVIVVLTTNKVQGINQAMLRPGRIDTVVPVRAPDAKAAERLMRLYGRGLIADKEDLTLAGEKLRGFIPASIREAVERSKLSAIRHIKPGDESIRITGADLVTAANHMQAQIDMLNEKREEPVDAEIEAAEIIGQCVEAGLSKIAASLTYTGRVAIAGKADKVRVPEAHPEVEGTNAE